MLSHLTFASVIANVLDAANVITGQILPEGSMEGKQTPVLGCVIEEASSPHQFLKTGKLALKYEFDGDATTLISAAAALQAAQDYLLGETGRAALREAMLDEGLWLRIIGPVSSPLVTTLGERRKSVEVRMPYWIQTAV